MIQAIIALTLAAAAGIAAAQSNIANYPNKPIRIIVPYPPGGATDVMARVIGQKLAESWGQPVVIENKAGASGSVGSEIVARAQPDGHTLLMASGSFGTLPNLFSKLPFDMEKDFSPVSLIATSPYVLVVQPSLQLLLEMSNSLL